MRKKDLLNELKSIWEKYWWDIQHDIISLMMYIEIEWVQSDNYIEEYKRIHKDSQKWIILQYLKNNPNKQVTWTDFIKFWKPFAWTSSNARLSELQRSWLVVQTWYVKWKTTKTRYWKIKHRDRKLYKITKKWLKFNLI